MTDITTEADDELAVRWYVRRGGTVRGPFDSAKIRHYLLKDKLTLDDEVSSDKQNWQRIHAVAEVIPRQIRRPEDAVVDQQLSDSGARHDRKQAVTTILVLLLLVVGAIVGVIQLDTSRSAAEADCEAPPAPSVQWRNCRLENARLGDARLDNASLLNARLGGATLARARMDGADLRYADFSGADLSHARLVGAQMKGANLRLANLRGADFTGADLSHADLGRAVVEGALFNQADLSQAIWIDGSHCAPGSLGQCRPVSASR